MILNRAFIHRVQKFQTKWLFGIALPLLACHALGCGKEEVSTMPLETLAAKEELLEVPLGYFMIPIPAQEVTQGVDWSHGNKLNLTFDLFAIVRPKDVNRVKELLTKHEKSFRNEVITVARRASLNDLREPNLATVKTQITIVAGRWLGQYRVRRLVISEPVLMPL